MNFDVSALHPNLRHHFESLLSELRRLDPAGTPQTSASFMELNALAAGIVDAKSKMYAVAATGKPRVRLLVYVNAGDDVVAPVTPGFNESVRAFLDGPCFSGITSRSIFYANEYENASLAQLIWNYRLTRFLSSLIRGDRLLFMVLTHGGIDEQGLEFLLGGMDERKLTDIAMNLGAGVSLFFYTPGCEQGSPIDCPVHLTVDARGRRIPYTDATLGAGNKRAFKANVVSLTDTWRGYLSQFEPPTFPVKTLREEDAAFNPILFNFLDSVASKRGGIKTYDELFQAYAESGWHALRSDEVTPGYSDETAQKIMDGTWNMFRPVIGLSSSSMLKSSCSHWVCSQAT